MENADVCPVPKRCSDEKRTLYALLSTSYVVGKQSAVTTSSRYYYGYGYGYSTAGGGKDDNTTTTTTTTTKVGKLLAQSLNSEKEASNLTTLVETVLSNLAHFPTKETTRSDVMIK